MIQSQTTDAMAELVALRDASVAFDADKHDHVMRCGDMKFDANFSLELPAETFGALPPVALTDHAKRQLYLKLGPGHYHRPNKALDYEYLENHTPRIRSILLNGHVKADSIAERSYMVRCYQNTGRAVLHSKFPTIANTMILDTVLDMLTDNMPPDTELVRPYLDPDRAILKIIWKNTQRDDRRGGYYALGTCIGNDEIGSGRYLNWPMIQSTGCKNSLMLRPLHNKRGQGAFDGYDASYDEENDETGDFVGLSLVHKGDKARMLLLIKDGLAQSLNASADLLNKMIEAETRRLPDLNDILADLGKKYHWAEDTATNVAKGTHGEETLSGLVNGITYAAQYQESIVDQVQMEALGGAILTNPDSLFGKAARAREYVTVR